jgi:hypothetical protein
MVRRVCKKRNYVDLLFFAVKTHEPSAVRHLAMIELPYFRWTRLLTQLGSLEFRDMFQVHFFRSAA